MTGGGVLGILDSLTGGEVIIVLIVALLVLGPDRLPDTARTLGQWMAKLRSMTSNLQSEVREVMDDPAMKPIRDVGEFVAAPRKKLVEFATAAEQEADDARRRADEARAAAEEAEAAARAAEEAAARAELDAEQAGAAADQVLAEEAIAEDALEEQAASMVDAVDPGPEAVPDPGPETVASPEPALEERP